MIVLKVIAGIAFLWAIAAGIAFGFHHWGSRMAPRSRMIFAALGCGLLITLPALAAILANGDGGSDTVIPAVAVLVGSVFIGVACLPATWWVTRKLERKDRPLSRPFE